MAIVLWISRIEPKSRQRTIEAASPLPHCFAAHSVASLFSAQRYKDKIYRGSMKNYIAPDGSAFFDLISTYLGPEDRRVVREAFELARREHEGEVRRSGEPFLRILLLSPTTSPNTRWTLPRLLPRFYTTLWKTRVFLLRRLASVLAQK